MDRETLKRDCFDLAHELRERHPLWKNPDGIEHKAADTLERALAVIVLLETDMKSLKERA